MRNLNIYLSALISLHGSLALHHGPSHFRDLQAFPKYEVQFLNHLPIAESDAKECLSGGIEREEEWMGARAPMLGHRESDRDSDRGRRRLSDGAEIVPVDDRLDLVRMALAPPGSDMAQSYLCLMPHPNTTAGQVQPDEDEPETAIDPVESWAALSHLDGKCLYSQQGWFTYSYCHNSHIRQFRAAPHAHPHPPGGYIPTEDPEQDAYTLGQAQPDALNIARGALPAGHGHGHGHGHGQGQGQAQGQGHQNKHGVAKAQQGGADPKSGAGKGQSNSKPKPKPKSKSTSIDKSTTSSTLGAPSRYLIQRWSDGTRCDKTGRPREIEIQIHCSMSSTDRIYLIKELAICRYVIIIHSPHLCSLPGFKAETVDVQPAAIRCRRVLNDEEFDDWTRGADAQAQAQGQGQGQGQGRLGYLPSLRPSGMEVVHNHHPGMISLPPTEEGDVVDVTGPTLKELLLQALEKKAAAAAAAAAAAEAAEGGGGLSAGGNRGEEDDVEDVEDEDVLLISLQEDEDGNPAIIVDSTGERVWDRDGMNSGMGKGKGDGEDDEQRQMILNAVKEYLAGGKKDHKKKREENEKGEGVGAGTDRREQARRDEL